MNEEQLLEFLYIAPVALIQFDEEGNVKMANPRVAQVFNRYAPGGYFANFFTFLDDVLPELKQAITSFVSPNGQIMENKRYCIKAPTKDDTEELWMDVTVMRQAEDMYIASLNNVTNQVRMEEEKFLVENKINRLVESVKRHVIFTVDRNGEVDTWNSTGEAYLGSADTRLGKVISQILPVSIEENANLLNSADKKGVTTKKLKLKDKSGAVVNAELCMSAIRDLRHQLRGFSVVLNLGG